jgi:hypothetical protein
MNYCRKNIQLETFSNFEKLAKLHVTTRSD